MENVIFVLENEKRGSFLSIVEETEKMNRFIKELRHGGLNVIKVAVSPRFVNACDAPLFDEQKCNTQNTLLIIDHGQIAKHYAKKGLPTWQKPPSRLSRVLRPKRMCLQNAALILCKQNNTCPVI